MTLTSSTGSTLSLTGTVATFTVNGASVLSSINNVVAGTTSVKKDGDGTLRLGATNAFSGGFELLRGGLQMGAANPLGSGDIVWHRNTTISTTAASSVQNIPAAVLYLDLAGSIANTLYNTGGGSGGTADKIAYSLPPDTVTYAGRAFTGKVDYVSPNSLTINSSSVVLRNGEEFTTNSYSANAGYQYFAYGAPAEISPGVNGHVYPYLQVNVSDPAGVLTLSGPISQADNITHQYDSNSASNKAYYDHSILKIGSGKLVLSGTRTYLGFTEVREGTLVLGGLNNASGTTSVVGVNGAAATLTIAHKDAVGAGRALFVTQGLLNFDIPAAQTPTFPIGWLATHSAASAAYNGGIINLSNADGRAVTLQVNRGDLIANQPVYGNIDYGTSQVYLGRITGSGGILYSGGTLDTFTLSPGHDFWGGVTAVGGNIVFTDNTSFGSATSELKIKGDVAMKTATSAGQFGGSSGRYLTIDAYKTLNLSLFDATSAIDLNAILRGDSNAKFMFTGGGTLSLSGDGTGYAGLVDVRAGSVVLGGNSVLGTGLAQFGDDSLAVPVYQTLTLTSDFNFASPSTSSFAVNGSAGQRTTLNFRGSGTMAIGQAGVGLNVYTAMDVVDGGSVNLVGAVGGAKGLLKSGLGELVFSSAGTLTGEFNLMQGPVAFSASAPTGSGDFVWHRNTSIRNTTSGPLIVNSGVLYVDLAGTNSASYYNTAGGSGGTADKAAIALPPDTSTYAGRAYTGRFDYTSPNALTINSNSVILRNGEEMTGNSYSANAGYQYFAYGNTVEVYPGVGGRLQPSVQFNISDRAGSLTISGGIGQQDNALYQYDTNNSNNKAYYDYSIKKVGLGKLSLMGPRTYLGSTEVLAGVLELGGTYLKSGTTTVSGAGVLLVSSPYAFSDGSAAATGDLNMNGGTVRFAGNVTSAIVDRVTGTSGLIDLTNANASGVNLRIGFASTLGSIFSVSNSVSITGAGGIEKLGLGTFDVTALTFDFTGPVVVSNGIWKLKEVADGGLQSGLGAASSASSNLVFNGGTIFYTNPNGEGSTNRGFTLLSAGDRPDFGGLNVLQVDTSTKLTISGSAAATSGSLTKKGAGTLVLMGDNLNTGALKLSEGTIVFGNAGSAGRGLLSVDTKYAVAIDAVANSNVTLLNSGTSLIDGGGLKALTFNGSGSLSLAGTTSFDTPGLNLVVNGTGALKFAGALSGYGFTKSGSGKLILASAANTGYAGGQLVSATGGTLEFRNQSAFGAAGVSLSGSAALVSASSGNAFSLSNALFVNGSAILAGESFSVSSLTLTGAASLTVVKDSTRLTDTVNNDITVSVGGQFTAGTSPTLTSFTKNGVGTLNVQSIGFSVPVTVQAGQLNILSGSTSATSTLTTNARLGLGNMNSVPKGGLTIGAAGTVVFLGSQIRAINLASLNGSGSLALNNEAGLGVDVNLIGGSTAVSTYTGSITGKGAVVVDLQSIFDIGSAANIYSGGSQIKSGTLKFGGDSALGLVDAAILDPAKNILIQGVADSQGATSKLMATADIVLSPSRGIALSGSGAGIEVATGKTLTVTSVVSNLAGAIGSLYKLGAGVLVLDNANTYTGDTVIKAGELRISSDTAIGANAGAYSAVRLEGGALTSQKIGVLTLASGRAVGITSSLGYLNANTGSILQIDSAISGQNAGLVINASTYTTALGEVRLFGANSFTNGIRLDQGRLVINSAASIGASGQTVDINLNGGTLVSMPGAGAQIALGVNYNVPISRSSAIEVQEDSVFDVAGLLDRTGTASALTITKQGRGTLILEGNNGFSGSWTLSEGVLQIGNDNQQGTLGSASARVTNNAKLSFRRVDDITIANVIGGSGVVSQDGLGYVRLTGANTYTGNTLVNAGSLFLGDSLSASKAALASSSTVSIGSYGNFVLGNVKTETVAGVYTSYTNDLFPNYVTGLGDLHVAVSPTTTLSFGKVGSANNYTGTTFVDSGTLRPLTADAISRSGAYHVASGASLDLGALGSSFILGNYQVLSGSGTVKLAPASTFIMQGTLSPGGATPYKVGIGTLTIGQASVGAAPNVILQAPSSIQAQGFQMYMDIGSSNLADKLVVPGNISVAGKLILINNLNVGGQGSADTGTFDVVVATGTVSKGANPTGDVGFILDDSNLQGYRSSLTYTTNKVTLSLTKMIEGGSLGALAVAPTFDFGSVHVNATARKNVPVKNTATGTNPDTLNVSFAPPAPGLTATGSITGLATTAGTNTTDLWLQLQTSTPGLKSSSVQLIVTSVSPISGQQPYTFAPALLNAVGKVYAYADPLVDATTLDIGSSHPNVAFVQKRIAILNNAPAGGYGESLQVQVGSGTSSNLNANGVILSLAAQATDSTSISAAFKAQGTAGLVNGSFTLDYVSINQPNSGLFPTALPSQTYNVVGRVYDYAVPDALSLPSSIALGSYHVNDVAMQAVTVTNTASAVSGYSESLTADVTTTGSVRSSGSVDSLAPQASSNAIRIGVSTAAPGALSGKANIGYTSVAFANSGLQNTALTSLGKSINVSATVYDYAHPVVPTTIDVGSVHVGEAFSFKAVNVQNQLQAYAAANPSYVEKLDVTFPNGTSSNVSTIGSIVALGAGDSSGTSLMVSLNSATSVVGSTNGVLSLGFTSKAIGGSNLQDTPLSTKNITITGKVYALAQVSMTGGATPVLNLGSVHSGDSIAAGFLAVSNSATASMYSETLKVAFDAITATNNLKFSGMVTGLQAGNTDAGSMQVSFLPGSVGTQVGSVNLLFTSQALPGSGIVGDTSLGQSTLTVRGTVYDYAKPVVPTTNFVLPAVHVGGSFGTLPISVSNVAAASANTESLNASLVSPTSGVIANNGSSGSITLAGQETDNTTLSIGLDSGLATTKGLKSGSASLRLVSKVVTGAVGLQDTIFANQALTVSAAVYDYASHNLPTTNTINLGPVRGGVTYAVPELAVTNTGSAGAYTEPLKVVFNNPSQEMVTTGSIAALAAGSQDTSTLKVGFVSGLVGPQSGSFNLRATSVGQAGLADTQLPSAAYTVTGTVYQVASASRLPTAIYLGAFHVGDDALRSLSIENTASSQAYGEGLTVDANLARKTSNTRIYGNISNLAPGATNSTSMLVGLDTASSGQVSGSVSLSLTSIPKVVPLQPLSLGNADITVSADVYSYAIPATANITVPSIHVGDPSGFLDGNIVVRNLAPAGLYSESLKATVLGASSNITARSSQVIASAYSSQGLTVNMATPTQGGQSYGTVTLGYTSLSVHTGVLGDTPLATQSVVEVRGNAYDYARGQVAMLSANLGNSLSLAPDGHIVFNIGDTRVGGTYADAFIPLKNSGPAGQYTETLRASLTTTSPDVSIFSGSVDIAPQEVNASTLKVGFTPLKAANAQLGPTSGNIRINLTSLADSGSGLRNTTLDPINVEVVGNAYQAAAPVLNKPIVRLGRPVYGPYMAVMDTNARYDSTGWIYSNADPVMSEGLTLRNNTPAGTWSESLGWTATLTGAAKLTDNGTLAGTLAPSAPRVLNLGLTPQAGVVTGTVHFDYISKAAANSTLQDVAIPVGAAADVTVRTVGYRAADWALPASTTVNRAMTDGSTQKVYRLNVGSVKTGQPFSTLDLIFSNTAPDTGGWTENLKVVVRNSTAKTVVGSAVPAGYSLAPITLNGGINALTWGRNSSAGDITATFAPGNSGNLAGYFGLDIYSSAIANPMVGGHGSSLGDYLLDSIIVELYGSVMDKATASVTSSIDFGTTRVGVPFAWRGVEVTNTGTSVSAASEMITARIDSVTLNGQARGTGVTNLAATAGANSNTTGIQANIDVSAAGNRSGVLTVNFSSTDGTTSTALDPQTVNLYGKVYTPADPYLATTVNLGSFRMGSTTTKNITIGNQAAGGFAESLGVTVNSVSAGLASTTLNQVAVAPGSTGVVAVGLGAGVTEGAFTGSVRLDMQSLGAYGLAPMQLASSTVAVSATVYKPADPSLVPLTGLVNGAVDLGYKHQGATWDTKSVYVQNLATGTAGFVESLGATLGSFTGDAASSSAAVTIAPGATSTALLLTLSDKTAGQKSGTAKVLYNSLATAGSGLNDLALTSQNDTITVKGYMYSGQGVWTGGSGNWSDDPLTITHWTKEGGRPGMDGQLSIDSRDSATFSNGLAAVITVDTANTIELATLTFNSAAGTRLAKTGANVGFKLNGSVTSGRGLIDVKLGSNTIDTPISFDTTANDIKLADNTSLYLYGDLSSASSGSGLTVQGLGTGTLYASGRITVSNFTIDSGRVVFQGSDPLSADVSVIVNGGSLDLAGNGQTVANLMVKGGVVTASGASRAAPSVIRASTFSKDSTGNAWLGDKNNREAVVITGMSGVSQVNTGKLYNNAWFKGELLVASGATLGGNGRSGAVYNYGTIAPGNSIDTYNAGSTVFYTGSTLSIEANQGSADLLNVTGTVTINSGANVQVIAYEAAPATPTATTLTAGTRHTIVSATGAIAGQFSTVVFDAATAALLPSDLRPTLLYGNDGAGRNTIDLLIGTISGPSGGAIGGTPFADYLQRHNGLVPLNFPSLLALGSGTPALYDTLDHIDLTTLSSLPSAIGRSGSRFTKVVASDVFAELTASGASFSGQGISKQNMLTAKDVLRAVDGVDTFTGTWTRGYSEVTSINQSDSRFDYDYTLAGVAAGIDLRRTQEETVGVAFGFSQFESKFSFDDGRTKGDGVDFGFYALHHSAAARMALGLSISRYSLSHQHNFTLAGLTKTAVGETSAQRMQLNFEGDRQLLAKDGWIYHGRAMADLELFRRNAFTESGAGELSLAVDGQRTTGLKLGLGVSAARTFARGDNNSGWTFVGELMAVQGWMSGDIHPTARLISDQTGDRYQVNAPSAQGLQVMPSLRLEYRTNNTGMTVELADEIGRGGSSPGFNLKFDTRF